MKSTTMKDLKRERVNRTEGVNIVMSKGRKHYVVCMFRDVACGTGVGKRLCAVKQSTDEKEAKEFWKMIKNT